MIEPDPSSDIILAALDTLGIKWARLSSPGTSGGGDLDIASSVSAPVFLEDLTRELSDIGPIMLSHYDIGGAHAVWFADAERGVVRHIDFLSDPTGSGRLGIPTDSLLAEMGGSHQPTSAWRMAYGVSKRLAKRQWGRLAQLGMCDTTQDRGPLDVVFGALAVEIENMVSRGAPATEWEKRAPMFVKARNDQRAKRVAGGRAGLWYSRSQRVLERVVSPVGIWIHIEDPDGTVGLDSMADEIEVSVARVRRVQSGALGPGFAVGAQLFRLRPGVVVSHGRRPRLMVDPVAVSASELVDGSIWRVKAVVDELSARVLASLA